MSADNTRVGFRLGYGTNGFADHTLADALDVLERFGYGAVALTLGHPHLDPFDPVWRESVDALRADLERRNMRVVVETGSRYLLDPVEKHSPTLLHDDAAARIAFLERAIDIAARLGADAVSLWSGVRPDGVGHATAWRRLVDRLGPLARRAHDAGVVLAVEPEPGMLVETVTDALRLAAELAAPDSLRLTVDLGHCVAVEPGGVAAALRQAGGRLSNVQVDDMRPGVHEHLPLGAGELDLGAAFDVLRRLDYCGIAAVELPRHSHDAPRLAAASMASMLVALDPLTHPAGPAWLTEARTRVVAQPESIVRFFPAVGREIGRGPVDPVGDPLGLRRGSIDDRARASLISVLGRTLVATDRATQLDDILVELYEHGDDAERRGVLAGIDTLTRLTRDDLIDAVPPSTVEIATSLIVDALRTNDVRLVSAALGDFAAEHLDSHSWRHGVLKCVFLGIPLDAVAGIERRSDGELRRMLAGLARERSAAGRETPSDVLQLIDSL